MTRTTLCILILSVSGAFAQNPAPSASSAASASIAGTTVDSATGKPVGAVIVTAVRGGLPPLSAHATSDNKGNYAITGLAAGSYTVCARSIGDGYLDPCQWSSIPATISLAEGQALTASTIKMIPGSIAQVRVNDPGQLLNTKTAAGAVADISIGVWGAKGLFYPAHLSSKDSAGASYQLTVPRDTLIALHIISRHLKLTDSTGTALPQNFLQQKFQSKSADANPPSFTFSVAALIP